MARRARRHRPPRAIQRLLWLAVLLATLGIETTAGAAPTPERALRIDLITVGPGDAFFTRAGHTALAVVELWPDGREMATVYNYGDADFEDPWLGLRFLFGAPRFRLAISGDLYDTVEYYGPMQNRNVYQQQLALTPSQARQVADHLAHTVLPENREYPYHYLQRTCTTEVRTLLDDVLGGALHEQLSTPDRWTVREYQQLTFDGDVVVALLADAVFGRLHDAPIDRFYAMMWPERMRDYLESVEVPDPSGQPGTVALASAPVLLAERGGAPATVSPNRITWSFAPIAGVVVLLGAIALRKRTSTPSRLHGAWLLVWSVPLGLVGLIVAVFSVASTVPELGHNELVASVLVTDLALVVPAVGWLRGRTTIPTWLPRYAHARLLVVGVALLLRGVGVFVQQPWVIVAASLSCGLALWWLVRGMAEPDAGHDDAAPGVAPTP